MAKNRVQFVLAAVLVAIVLDSSFAEDGTIKLNDQAFTYAQQLIGQGHVVVDKRNDWHHHHPDSQQEEEFIRARGFAEYAKWHLGIDATHAQNSKARFKFPFGDFRNIHRCALLAVKSRAHQYGYSDIENAVERLLEMVDSKEK